MSIKFEWEGYKPEGYRGSATWTVDGFVQAVEFPTFAHANAMDQLIMKAYRAGRKSMSDSLRELTNTMFQQAQP